MEALATIYSYDETDSRALGDWDRMSAHQEVMLRPEVQEVMQGGVANDLAYDVLLHHVGAGRRHREEAGRVQKYDDEAYDEYI